MVAIGNTTVEAHRILPDEEHVPPAAQLVLVHDQVVPDREGKVVHGGLPVGHNLS